jgi:O-antigen/teichoic acid export membrane protein
MVASGGVMAIFGFVYWLVAARFYPTEEVGIGTAVIAAAMLVATLARFGLEVAIVRFLPDQENKSDMINTSITIAGLFSVIISLIFIAGLKLWSPDLIGVLHKVEFVLLFILYTSTFATGTIQSNLFMAFRAGKYALWRSILTGLRIPVVIILSSFGTIGIFSGFGFASVFTFIISIYFIAKLQPGYRFMPIIRKDMTLNMMGFSFGNYIAETLKALPQYVLPLIIVGVLDPTKTAYFSIAWAISSLLLMVSYMGSFVLLAEVSYSTESQSVLLLRAAKLILIMSIPVILIFLFLGKPILTAFGGEYADNAYVLLQLLSVAAIPYAINSLYVTMDRIRKGIKVTVLIYLIIFVLTLLGSYMLMKPMGINGVGVAWLGANLVVSLSIISKYLGQRLISRYRRETKS